MMKKGQLKIQEMSFMLVAVFIFFIFAALFVTTIIYTQLYEGATISREERARAAVKNLADSPEFSCSSSKSNCVDADKLIVLLGQKDYDKFWPDSFSSLKVIKSSAFNKSLSRMIECTMSNYPNCDIFVVYDRRVRSSSDVSSFVSLCRVEKENAAPYEKCEIAKLAIESETAVEGE
jgi:hypothetical protein